MGVNVRQKPKTSGIWWVFIEWRGKRKAKRCGTKEAAESLAVAVRDLLNRADVLGVDSESLSGVMRIARGDCGQRSLTLSEYAGEHWLPDNSKSGGWKHSTKENYKSVLRKHIRPDWEDVPLEAVTRRNVKDWLNAKAGTLSPKTIQNLHRVISSILSAAVDDELLKTNPVRHMGRVLPKVKQSKKALKAWTIEQRDRLLRTVRKLTPEHYPLFFTLSRTGLRIGECVGLQWGDLDLERREALIQRSVVRGRVTDTKARRHRIVKLSTELVAVLERHRLEQKRRKVRHGQRDMPPWVFCNPNGKPLDPDNLRGRHWYRIVDQAKVPNYGFHGFRDTVASHLLRQGVPIFKVSRMLGHSSISTTTDIYGHILPEDEANIGDLLDSATPNTA